MIYDINSSLFESFLRMSNRERKYYGYEIKTNKIDENDIK